MLIAAQVTLTKFPAVSPEIPIAGELATAVMLVNRTEKPPVGAGGHAGDAAPWASVMLQMSLLPFRSELKVKRIFPSVPCIRL